MRRGLARVLDSLANREVRGASKSRLGAWTKTGLHVLWPLKNEQQAPRSLDGLKKRGKTALSKIDIAVCSPCLRAAVGAKRTYMYTCVYNTYIYTNAPPNLYLSPFRANEVYKCKPCKRAVFLTWSSFTVSLSPSNNGKV